MLGRDVWRDTGALRAVGASDAQTIFDDGEPGMDSDSLGTEVDGIERDSTSLARRGCTPLQDHSQALRLVNDLSFFQGVRLPKGARNGCVF